MFRELLLEAKPSTDLMKKVGIIFKREMNGEKGIVVDKPKAEYNARTKTVLFAYKDGTVNFKPEGDSFYMTVRDADRKTIISTSVSKDDMQGLDSTLVNAVYAMFGLDV